MIERLFSYESCDPMDHMTFQAYGCILKTTLGEVLIGTEVDCISVDLDRGELILYFDEKEIKFNLRLKVMPNA